MIQGLTCVRSEGVRRGGVVNIQPASQTVQLPSEMMQRNDKLKYILKKTKAKNDLPVF